MLQPRRAPRSHEDLFLDRYAALLARARRLVDQDDPSRASDLLHDAFVLFTSRKPDVDAIDDLDAYLATMLRNLRLSQVRRSVRFPETSLSIVDYDSAFLAVRGTDPAAQLHVRRELRRICAYACARKAETKSASVLLLRFFHGYYPAEIGRVMRCGARTVNDWLKLARLEVKGAARQAPAVGAASTASSAGDVAAHGGVGGADAASHGDVDDRESWDALLADLRGEIARARTGPCVSVHELRDLYHGNATTGPDCATLAHIVSCGACLRAVLREVGLPWDDRGPTDTLGRDPGGDSGGGVPRNGSRRDAGSAGGAGHAGPRRLPPASSQPAGRASWLREARRAASETAEHRPTAIRLAVNGFSVGLLRVSGERSEVAFTVNVQEPVGFVEAFSEQNVRLALMAVDPPPNGPAEQRDAIALGDGRLLSLVVRFDSAWPLLQAVYVDEAFEERVEESIDALEARLSRESSVVVASIAPIAAARPGAAVRPGAVTSGASAAADGRAAVRRARRRAPAPVDGESRPRHGFVAALGRVRDCLIGPPRWIASWTMAHAPFVASIVAIAVIVAIVSSGQRPLSAEALLGQSRQAEAALTADRSAVVRRTIHLEERRLTGTDAIARQRAPVVERRRIELWQKAGDSARRVYDERGRLIAGEWRQGRDRGRIYRKDGPRVRSDAAPREPLAAREFWRMDPSAEGFARLVDAVRPTAVQVADATPTNVTVVVRPAQDARDEGLVEAQLTIRKADLHATRQVLRIQEREALRELTFVEDDFDRVPADRVSPEVFEPDAELLPAAPAPSPAVRVAPALPALPPPAAIEPSAAELDRQELEVWHRLHRVDVCVDVPSLLTRVDGVLIVSPRVEDEVQRRLVLQAFEGLGDRVRVDARLAASTPVAPAGPSAAASAAASTAASAPASPSASDAPASAFVPQPATVDAAPMTVRVREHFREAMRRSAGADEPPPATVQTAARQFALWVLEQSRRRAEEARALDQLVTRWSPGARRTLDLDGYAMWLGMVRQHARAVARETEVLRAQLQPLLPPAFAEADEAPAAARAAAAVDVDETARRLIHATREQDVLLRRMFGGAAAIDGERLDLESLGRGLVAVERLAGRINEPRPLDD